MTSLREAATQALEALEDMLGWQSLAPQTIQESAKGRAYALKAALAEPVQEPVAYLWVDVASITGARCTGLTSQQSRADAGCVYFDGVGMTDRELLELAAKAAGIELVWSKFSNVPTLFKGLSSDEVWNPLTDDGDALRLAVRLRLHARQFPIVDDGFDAPLGMVEAWRVDDEDPLHVEFLRSGDDRLVTTRRAIVRAAAEIGRSMA